MNLRHFDTPLDEAGVPFLILATEYLETQEVDHTLWQRVAFTEGDLLAMERVATDRRAAHRHAGTVEPNQFRRGRLSAEMFGLAGEWAVADALDLPRCCDTSAMADGGTDLVVGALGVDVKYTPNWTGRMMVPANQKIRSDAMILVVQGETVFDAWIVGGVTTEEFRCRKHWWDWGYGPTQYLVQHELIPWSEFREGLR